MNRELEKIIIKIETDVLTYAEKELLKTTLTPPTQEEVCAFIEKDIKGKARYSYGQFYIDNEKVDDILLGVFRPKTLIAIGKFYEELEKWH